MLKVNVNIRYHDDAKARAMELLAAQYLVDAGIYPNEGESFVIAGEAFSVKRIEHRVNEKESYLYIELV
jgi:hypothetical protein